MAIVVKLFVVGALALLAFGIQKRRLSFFGIRCFGWQDFGAMFLAMFWAVSLVFIATPVVQHFSASASSAATDADDIPFGLGLGGAIVAGISEEFMYRGFLIEKPASF
ncbi:MAG TPA: hypothetical protein VGG72_14930 [Bryobacteraceae bacterium]